MFLIRVKHLVHYYHIGTRSSHVGNYSDGDHDSIMTPILQLQGIQLINFHDGGGASLT